ncbi:mandelate racemase/muconate lactonizing enzyme family protein [Paenibacillus roseipurpureus]|uniref:Mandelate racemase/muconate lactonizing enzyme family protein n=1 Tax=Paenibacillus roseopurpureus TaxID=2918901 RepID=A0AA96RJC9_9BACL|nr:mandelate racemase/muconate lactonizing enzyme family protein [Paenibacillus sp. MBLB1832]WNR45258.1 mandelate racemase/muconate lactonizing enzyme family protein [Paenibacillus sp. MBLB1832]
MQLHIVDVRAIPLAAKWEHLFGGLENVPASLLRPAAHFQTVPRLGQFSTIVYITASDSTVGIGECWGLPLSDVTATIVNHIFRPLLIGRDPREIGQIWEMLITSAESLGHTRGFMMDAISGIDIALWDLQGKRLDQPLHHMAGGKLRDEIECYASPIRFSDNTQDTIDNAREFTDLGFKAVKVKAGRTIEKDAAYIGAIREALGKDIRILIDFNCAYTVQQTIEFAREVEQYNIFWFEEPLPPDHVDELAQIRKAIHIPVSTGENDFSVQSFRLVAEKGAVDIINPNITRCGGITGLQRIQSAIEPHGVQTALHGVGAGIMMSASLHMMSTLRSGLIMEYNRFLNPLRETLVEPAIAFNEGFLQVPDGPGLGCSLVEETLHKFAVT